MKKVLIILICLVILGGLGVLGYYNYEMSPKSSEERIVAFTVEAGSSKKAVANKLEDAGLIRNRYCMYAYLFFNPEISIQAGDYELSPSMRPEEMFEKFQKGDVKIVTETITFIEGERLTDYAKRVSVLFDITSEEFMETVNDKEWIQELVDNGTYWFLTDEVLNPEIYYPLEGYLYPDTYEFKENVTSKEIVTALLNQTEKKLEPLKSQIEGHSYSVHQLLTMASIIEKEANSSEDREKASQVFWKRLTAGDTLGSDVTTYYGVRKVMGEDLTYMDLENHNPYNTRLTDGSMNGKLPIGPICNSDITSVTAALNPSDTNYYYFVANVCTGEVFFSETHQEFLQKVYELQSICDQN